MRVYSGVNNSHLVGCGELENNELRGLVAVVKISNFLVGKVLHPEIPIKREGQQSIDNALEELMLDSAVLDEMIAEVPMLLDTA